MKTIGIQKAVRAVKVTGLLALMLAAPGGRAEAAEWPAPTGNNFVACSRGDSEQWRVRMLQYLLRSHNLKATVDGKFGKQTEQALRLFQKREGLEETGEARDPDWKALTSTLRRGDEGNAVRALQVGINRFIHEHTSPRARPIPVDGKFGALTEKWLRQVQQGQEDVTPGVADGFTWFNLLFDEH